MVISIHTSAREVTVRSQQERTICSVFQSTLPQGKWLWDGYRDRRRKIFQSTLPQGKWPAAIGAVTFLLSISIHTSAREVTEWASFSDLIKNISIHTSAREVTCCVDSKGCRSQHFNPHFRKGSDLRQLPILPCNHHFNPHFRKGSDGLRGTCKRHYKHFNPHFRKGSDGKSGLCPECYKKFQSTLPQGKWLQYSTKTSVYFYEISINIFEFTFVYYWNTLSIQKAHSNLFIFTGASLPVILCMLDTRTCKL